MFDRIIVPLDGGGFAEAALAPACELARVFGSQLLIVRARPTDMAPSAPAMAVNDVLESLDEADAYLHGVCDELRAGGCNADMLLYVAQPGEAIVRAAEIDRADLIVMATHTRWSVHPMSMPSTTVSVLAQCSAPVLAWRPPTSVRNRVPVADAGPVVAQPETPIIVPLDGSLRAESALPIAEALARAFGTYLVLVHALALSPEPRPKAENRLEMPLQDAVDASTYLDLVRSEVIARGGHATTVVRTGQPFQVIERCWREFGGSIIVTASRGQAATLHGLLGSVARRLIEELEAPVLVIPPEHPAVDGSIPHTVEVGQPAAESAH